MSCWTEDLPELPGIYKLTNLVNGKIYVGESENLFGRLKFYQNESLRRTIIYAIKKYGWDNFRKEAIEVFPIGTSKKILLTRETFWIKFLRSHVLKHGYNEIEDTIDPRGEIASLRRKYRRENNLTIKYDRRPKGDVAPERYPIDETASFKSKPVYQCDLRSGEIIKEWPSANAASFHLSGGTSGAKVIARVARKEYGSKSYKGFSWKFVFSEHNGVDPNAKRTMSDVAKKKISKSLTGKCAGEKHYKYGKKLSKEQREDLRSKAKCKPVNQLNPLTREVIKTWASANLASFSICGNTNRSGGISSCARGLHGYKNCLGFAWEYAKV